MSAGPPVTVITGQPTQFPLRCNLRGSGGTTAAQYNATDVLSAAVFQHGASVPLFVPAVTWYTAGSTQTGYEQGEVEPVFTTAQAALLVPTISYTIMVWRALTGSPAVLDPIARVPLVVEALAA